MLKLKRFLVGVFVDYPGADGVRFKIKPSTFSQSLDVLTQVREKKVVGDWPIDPKDPTKRGPHVIDDFHDGVFLWKMFDQTLEAWDGIDPTPEGENDPLGPNEIKKLIFDNDAMREFIFENARRLAGSEEAKQDLERKNS